MKRQDKAHSYNDISRIERNNVYKGVGELTSFTLKYLPLIATSTRVVVFSFKRNYEQSVLFSRGEKVRFVSVCFQFFLCVMNKSFNSTSYYLLVFYFANSMLLIFSRNVAVVTRTYLISNHTHGPVKVIWRTVHFGCGRETTNEWEYKIAIACLTQFPLPRARAFPCFQFMKFAYKYYAHYARPDEYNREYKQSRISAFACELFQFFVWGRATAGI